MQAWKHIFHALYTLTVHLPHEQGFPGRSGTRGAKVILMNLYLFIYFFYISQLKHVTTSMHIYQVSAGNRGKPKLQVLLWPHFSIIIIGSATWEIVPVLSGGWFVVGRVFWKVVGTSAFAVCFPVFRGFRLSPVVIR